MKRVALVLATLSLVGVTPAFGADKSDTKTEIETKADKNGSTTTTERSSDRGGAKNDEKTEVQHKKRSDGLTETTKTKKHKTKASGRVMPHTTKSKEKTVTDQQGNVIEHQKDVK